MPDTRRLVPLLAAVAGGAFAAFPLLRPWGDKSGDPHQTAQAFADPLWVYSHVAGMAGWLVLAIAVVVAAMTTRGTGEHRRTGSVGATWLIGLGAAAVLPYYGAETFALHVLGDTALAQDTVALVRMESAIRVEPVAVTLFAAGLLLIAIGSIVLAVQTWKRGRIRWAGVPLAVLLCLYLPQFFAPDLARIAHGLLLGLACLGWGMAATTAPLTVRGTRTGVPETM